MLAIAVAVGALCVTGCSGGPESTIAPAAQGSPGAPADARASLEAQLGFPPKPDAQTAQAYLADLRAIDPALVAGDPESLVNRGRDQCRDLKARPEKEWAKVAGQRFSTPQAPQGVGEATATRIIQVVRTRLCPTF
ncbi:hypothetical protein FHX34_103604 [Actinoplanes teichomyceticus]|uniref:DUF732 domain-containing protein n=2 Tax=Actinoplanes teichomyceticus TaxID=1867 RepID=A0A561WB36_ACTTI|nr:hypothetical protein FHX34_103604 [Actinoplanes teichomyceticus]GIF14894.1 hypothetical protein Ate01nite_49260 [Actinoplanes teichomyceticus]